MARWIQFLRERHPPVPHVLLAALFFAGSWAAAQAILGGRLDWARGGVLLVVVNLLFLRLRVLDEIKDHEADRTAHPERPLARGLISPEEAKRAALLLAFAEAAGCLVLGVPAAWASVSAFTYLMYREFFIGDWLRPRAELYALMHTPVAGAMSLLVASAVSAKLPWALPIECWLFATANWAVFNVFEFARKTWGTEEESAIVSTSYSRRLGPRVAVATNVAMAAGAVVLASLAVAGLGSVWLLPATVGAASAPYAVRPTVKAARWYRRACELFLAGFYVWLTLAARPWEAVG